MAHAQLSSPIALSSAPTATAVPSTTASTTPTVPAATSTLQSGPLASTSAASVTESAKNTMHPDVHHISSAIKPPQASLSPEVKTDSEKATFLPPTTSIDRIVKFSAASSHNVVPRPKSNEQPPINNKASSAPRTVVSPSPCVETVCGSAAVAIAPAASPLSNPASVPVPVSLSKTVPKIVVEKRPAPKTAMENDAPPSVPFARMPQGSSLAAKAKRTAEATVKLATPFVNIMQGDPLRQYLSTKDELGADSPTPQELDELRQMSWHRIPLHVQQAFDSFEMVALTRTDITTALTTLNVKSHTILRIDLQRRILAIKLVQRQLSLLAVIQCRRNIDKANPHIVNEQHHRIRSLPPTSVWKSPMMRPEGTQKEIPWSTGDIPVFDPDGNVIPGQPSLVSQAPAVPSLSPPPPRPRPIPRKRSIRQSRIEPRAVQHDDSETSYEDLSVEAVPFGTLSRPRSSPNFVRGISEDISFDDSEFCRLLHVMAESQAQRIRRLLLTGSAGIEPFIEASRIYNDVSYRPERVPLVEDVVSPSDVAFVRPEVFRLTRSPRELANMYDTFRSRYSAAIDLFNHDRSRWLNELKEGRAAIAYAFCLIHLSADLKLIFSSHDEKVRTFKRRRSTVEVPTSSNGQVDGQMRSPEDEKKLFEAEEARVRFLSATLVALREARAVAAESRSEDERRLGLDLIDQLKRQLHMYVTSRRAT